MLAGVEKFSPLKSFNNQLTLKQLVFRNFTTTRTTTFQLLRVFVFLFTWYASAVEFSFILKDFYFATYAITQLLAGNNLPKLSHARDEAAM